MSTLIDTVRDVDGNVLGLAQPPWPTVMTERR